MNNTLLEAVVAALKNVGLLADGHAVQRTILVSDCYFVGLKFHYKGGYAIWLADPNKIMVYDKDGTPLNPVCLDSAEAEKAA